MSASMRPPPPLTPKCSRWPRADHDERDAHELSELASVDRDAQLSWDSAERTEAHVAGIQSEGQPAAAAAWKQADVDNARHPREAVFNGKATSSKARVPSTAAGKQLERGR